MSPFSSLLPALYAVTPAPLPPVGMQWIAVRQRFQQFHNDLTLTPRQFLDGMTKRNGVVNCLNRRYYGSASDTDNSFLVGELLNITVHELNRRMEEPTAVAV